MKSSMNTFRMVLLLLVTAALHGPALEAQNPSSLPGVPAQLIVTVEARHGKTIPNINRKDVMVYQGHDRAQVTDWIPFQGEHAQLELFLLMDDGLSDAGLGPQLEDFRKFINSLPATTSIGVGYMRNGTVEIAQNLTTDHAAAAKAVRLPFGASTGGTSPYFSLQELLKNGSRARRAGKSLW